MGIFSKKKPKDNNYINFNSALTSPYVQSSIKQSIIEAEGKLRDITQADMFEYAGVARHLVEFEFPGGALRLCNDPIGDIYVNGKRFISDGSLLAFDDAEESVELNQRGMTIKLSSSSDTLISLFNQAAYIKVPVRGYHAYMDMSLDAPTPEVPLFVIEFQQGYIDKPEFTWNAVTAKAEFKITTTSMLAELGQAVGQRTAHALHQLREPGDNFYKFANVTQNSKKQRWVE
ncbi:hypothetical protein J4G57_05240 [Aeromonas caviae]|uniref:hypothetical protein n=1 Tax=Aeromonas TaxID=642 RepID=UPI000F76CA19|nr:MULTISPECIES: hypothetical protein [Aeromonas]MBS4707297.1 hypothetical protein [Aeromonas caviae]RSM32304.1 hypothetical protein C5B78_01060 [Aeromonas salmonicida]